MYHSQYGQDRFVHERFFPRDDGDGGGGGGFFLDVGAHDGLFISNSLFFERERGWRGICVEACDREFARLRDNRSAECLYGAAFDRDGTVAFRRVDGAPGPLSGVESEYDARHVARIERELRQDGRAAGEGFVVQEVPCFRLDGVLRARGVRRVNYLSLDVEGGELAVLRGLGFGARAATAATTAAQEEARPPVEIDVMTIEDNYGDTRELDALLGATHDRLPERLGNCDVVYVRRGFEPNP